METVQHALEIAIGTGELVNIIYHGGSEPGTARMILPIKIEGDKVRAKCYVTNKVKVFNLEKMELALSDKINFSGEHKEPENLQTAVAPFLEELKNLRWDIETDNETFVYLYTFFKNGKRRKTPDVGISFHASNAEDPEWDDGINHRPWYVHGHAFKYLGKAILKFMEFARDKAPTKEN